MIRCAAALVIVLLAGACGPGADSGTSSEGPTKAAADSPSGGSAGAQAAAFTGGQSDAGVLPGDGFLDAWRRSEPEKVFKGANLYGHINGGAEVFLELGFDRCEVQRYVGATEKIGEGDKIIVELYHMADPAAALGIYLMKCGREERDPSFEVRHTAGPYQILFQKGRVFAILSNPEGSKAAGEALLPFAKHIADALPAETVPDLFAPLPQKDRVTGTERIVRGPFTLGRLFTLGAGDILELGGKVTAVAADYEDGDGASYTRILADYPNGDAAKNAFRHVVNNLDGYLEVVKKSGDLLIFKDYADKFGKVGISGRRIDIAVNLSRDPTGEKRGG